MSTSATRSRPDRRIDRRIPRRESEGRARIVSVLLSCPPMLGGPDPRADAQAPWLTSSTTTPRSSNATRSVGRGRPRRVLRLSEHRAHATSTAHRRASRRARLAGARSAELWLARYGPRVAIWRLIESLDRHGIRASALVNSEGAQRYPQTIEAGPARGWAWLTHGRTNSRLQTCMTAEEERVGLTEVVASD